MGGIENVVELAPFRVRWSCVSVFLRNKVSDRVQNFKSAVHVYENRK